MRRVPLILLAILISLSFHVSTSVEAQTSSGNISFEPNQIPFVNSYYEDYSFVFELKDYFIRVRPFVIYNETYYGMKQIVTWIKNNYPNVDYRWLIDKAENAIHYGFNLTKLPQSVADKIDYLGFRLVDLNFSLSWFELEIVEDFEHGYNFTRIHIPKANLCFSFEDLYPYGYEVKHVNATYVLVGNVKGRTDLCLDPITFSGGIITVTDFTEDVPCTFNDLYDADKGGERTLKASATYTADTTFSLDEPVRAADYRALKLKIQVTAGGGVGYNIMFNGLDMDGVGQSETLLGLDVGITTTTKWFKSINTNGTSLTVPPGGSITFRIYQAQWGVVWKTGTSQFMFDCKLVIGDGSTTTWFIDSDKQIIFGAVSTASFQNVIYVRNSATFRLGILVSESLKTTRSGCHVVSLESTYIEYLIYGQVTSASIYLYSSHFSRPSTTGRGLIGGRLTRVWHSSFDGQTQLDSIRYADVFDMVSMYGDFAISSPYGTTNTFDQITIGSPTSALYQGEGASATFSNMYIRGISSYLIEFRAAGTSYPVYLINVDSDKWTFFWGSPSTATVYRQYEFDLAVTYPNGTAIQNANVTITNAYLGTSDSWLTPANGSIPTQTYSMGHYNQTGGNTLYDYNPYTLSVSTDGYQTHTQTFTLAEPTDWTTTLTPIAKTREPEAGPAPTPLPIQQVNIANLIVGKLAEYGPIIAAVILIVAALVYLAKKEEKKQYKFVPTLPK